MKQQLRKPANNICSGENCIKRNSPICSTTAGAKPDRKSLMTLPLTFFCNSRDTGVTSGRRDAYNDYVGPHTATQTLHRHKHSDGDSVDTQCITYLATKKKLYFTHVEHVTIPLQLSYGRKQWVEKQMSTHGITQAYGVNTMALS
ncbi:hypothetical protein DINM_002061 [Dirofilaria immitis]|nr:hypothetical protein [Dirofilaria immitis]